MALHYDAKYYDFEDEALLEIDRGGWHDCAQAVGVKFQRAFKIRARQHTSATTYLDQKNERMTEVVVIK